MPNFGVDEDIVNVQNSIKYEQDKQGHVWTPTQDSNGYWNLPAAASNASYSYNVQLDSDIKLEDDPICSSAGCSQYKHPAPPPGYPMDYPVPNFGQDHDIKSSIENERLASKMIGKEWAFKTPGSWEKYRNKAKDTMYNFKPALDHDMVSTQKNIANAEGEYGNWDLLQTESDPICSSAGCTQYKHPEPPKGPPMDYPVPDFGVDHEIINSMEDERLASSMLGH